MGGTRALLALLGYQPSQQRITQGAHLSAEPDRAERNIGRYLPRLGLNSGTRRFVLVMHDNAKSPDATATPEAMKPVVAGQTYSP